MRDVMENNDFPLNLLQDVLPGSQSDLLTLVQRSFPLNVGIGIHKMIVMAFPTGFCQIFSQLAVRNGGRLQAGIGTGLIQRHRIKACKHTDIWQNGRIVLPMAITVGADILHQGDVEAGTSMADGLSIFRHLAVQQLVGAVVGIVHRVKVTGTDAAPAAPCTDRNR